MQHYDVNKTENKQKYKKYSKNILTYKEVSDIMKSQTKKSKHKAKRKREEKMKERRSPKK